MYFTEHWSTICKKKKKELNCISLFQSKKTRKVPIFESQMFDSPY